MNELVHHILHLDDTLSAVVNYFGNWSYIILMLVIFAETGLVITPFLPGDSLLLAAGALSSISILNLSTLIITLCTAGILGNQCNYFIGRWIGPKVFKLPRSRWFNPTHLNKAHQFYKHHGALAIILSRFLPIIRTLAPFVAGIARMNPKRFSFFNAIGCVIWATPLLLIGYVFGNLPVVKDNFSIIIIFIAFISLLPAIIGLMKNRKKAAEYNSPT